MKIGIIDLSGKPKSAHQIQFHEYYFSRDGFDCTVLPDSSVLFAATMSHPLLNDDIVLIKVGKDAQPIWTKALIGDDNIDQVNSIRLTKNNNLVIAGKKIYPNIGKQEAFIVKTDTSGAVVWARLFDRPEHDEFFDVAEIGNSLYAVGSSDSIGRDGQYALVIKTDAGGHSIWAKGFGAPLRAVTSAVAISDALLLCGTTRNKEPYIFKMDTNGNIAWTKVYRFDDETYVSNMILTADSGALICGSYGKYRESPFLGWFLLKVNSDGDISWSKFFGGHADYYGPGKMQELPDHSILSHSRYELRETAFIAYKTDSMGNCSDLCEISGNVTTSSITVADSTFVFTESYTPLFDSSLTFAIFHDTLGTIDSCNHQWNEIETTPPEPDILVSPNPASSKLSLDKLSGICLLSISDLKGLHRFHKETSSTRADLDISFLPPGIYILTVLQKDKVYKQKILVE